MDVTMSAGGEFASVRTVRTTIPPQTGSAGAVYAWDLSTNPPTLLINAAPHVGGAEGDDCVRLLGPHLLAQGTYELDGVPNEIRMWNLALTPPGLVGVATALNSDGWDSAVAWAGVGMGPVGAVRHRYGGVSLWDLTTGLPLAPQASYQLPDITVSGCILPSSVAGEVRGTADCIALTAGRIVSIANEWDPNQIATYRHFYWGAVGIAEFQGQPGWPKTFMTQPDPPQCPQPQDPQVLWYHWVHDLAVSPDGVRAAVSGTDWIGVYNINRGLQIGVRMGTSYPTPSFYGSQSRQTLDSVEMTNDRVVVIGNAFRFQHPYDGPNYGNNPPPNDNESFEICVLALRGDTIDDERVWTTNMLVPNLPFPARARACDLTITPNQSRAIVSTRRATIVFDLTDKPSTMTPQVLLTTADPLTFTTGTAFPSDVVACTDMRAVVIGRRPKPSNPAILEGVIDVLDLVPAQPVPPAPPVLASILSTVVIGDSHIPTDVVITPDGSRAIVRSANPNVIDTDVNASRLTVVELLGGTVEFQTDASHGALGVARGVDHLECDNKWVVTAGEFYAFSPSCAVQFLRLP